MRDRRFGAHRIVLITDAGAGHVKSDVGAAAQRHPSTDTGDLLSRQIDLADRAADSFVSQDINRNIQARPGKTRLTSDAQNALHGNPPCPYATGRTP